MSHSQDPALEHPELSAAELLREAGVVFDHGDPAAEYRAVREGAGIVDRNDLAQLRLTGRDPVRMIQGLITGDLAGAPEDRAVYGVMLTPKGRTIAELRALKRTSEGTTEVWLQLPREVLDATTAHLRRSVPPLYARSEDVSGERATIGVYGPRAAELLAQLFGHPASGLEEDAVAVREWQAYEVILIGTRYAGGEEGFDLLIHRTAAPELRQALLSAGGDWARPVGFKALEVLRIEGGVPRGGHELTEDSIPTEAFEAIGLMPRAISFDKGCYTGQEVIVRIAHRGHVNRHLRGLVLPEGSELPAVGTRLHHPETGRDVGWITSVAESPKMGAPVALAYVRRELEPGIEVPVGSPEGSLARVSELPFTR